MQNEALSYLGLNYVYLAFDVDREKLPGAIDAMRSLKIRGGNISMPNKIAVMQYLDKLTPEAKLGGAVNTIINNDGVLTGHCTDGIGYIRALSDAGYTVKNKKMTIIGAGGAAKAIQIQSALSGAAEISIFNIHDSFWERACDTAKLLNSELGCRAKLYDLEDRELLEREIKDSDIVANATNLGMTPQAEMCPVPDGTYFRPGQLVTDVVYSPPKTKFLWLAEKAGCEIMNGFPMMLFQGAEAFRLWTGEEMPIAHMKEFLHF